MDLTQLNEGESATVIEITGGRGVISKLDSMGIRPGVVITKISSVMTPGPVVLSVKNTNIAIGYGMAKKIIVKK